MAANFALSQFDLMEKIGREVEIARETAANKAKFAQVIKGVEMMKPFVELNNSHGGRPGKRLEEDNFLRDLWKCHCEGWPSEESLEEDFEAWYDEDDDLEYIKVKEDWIEACPFKYKRDWQYDYYTPLIRLPTGRPAWQMG